MYKLIIGFFCIALFSAGCGKNMPKCITAKEFEEKLMKAAKRASQLIEDKRKTNRLTGELRATIIEGECLSEQEAIEIAEPLIDPGASFLEGYYGINIYEYFGAGSPEIARLGALALRFKQLEDQGKAVDTSQINSWFENDGEIISEAHSEILSAASEPSIFDCAMDALGVPAALIVGSAKSLSRAALLKAAKKLASRTLGWIGLGIAIYEFGDCMNWW